ncbi:hypothetical protein EDM56_19000 [Brevibacillus fluminis]|uniref:Uncharacterized protein n=1 Tax=Brevibacillus fluminis TaxID=511487 RepID=A0A3M8DAK7_9BACL|nr:hypothetical protein [Brevibacillus fluminis]RNB85008.1 hypothetical protein EDM56_19000 [Brevibacillus fluminis]
MKKKLVLVLDVELDKQVDMQQLTDKFSSVIQTVDEVELKDLVLFDNDETSADKLIAKINK